MQKANPYRHFKILVLGVGSILGFGATYLVDNLLNVTQGQLNLALLAIIFLTTSYLSFILLLKLSPTKLQQTNWNYITQKISPRKKYLFGLSQTIIIIPIVSTILSILIAVNIADLLDIANLSSSQVFFLSVIIIILVYLWNIAIKPATTKLPNLIMTLIGLAPFFVIIFFALIFGTLNAGEIMPTDQVSTELIYDVFLFLAPIIYIAIIFIPLTFIPVIFSSQKNNNLNLTLVITASAAIIFALFLLTVTFLLPINQIIYSGNDYFSNLINRNFSPLIASLINFSLIILNLMALNLTVRSSLKYQTMMNQLSLQDPQKISSSNNQWTITNKSFITTLIFLLSIFLVSVSKDQTFFINNVDIITWPVAIISLIIIYLTANILFKNFPHPLVIIFSLVTLIGQVTLIISVIIQTGDPFLQIIAGLAITIIGVIFTWVKVKKQTNHY